MGKSLLGSAEALDLEIRERTYVGLQFIADGRAVLVRSVDTYYVQYVTWAEGKGRRKYRTWATWSWWRKKYARYYVVEKS